MTEMFVVTIAGSNVLLENTEAKQGDIYVYSHRGWFYMPPSVWDPWGVGIKASFPTYKVIMILR